MAGEKRKTIPEVTAMAAACSRGFSEGRETESKAAALSGLPLCLNLAQKNPSGLSVNRQIDAVPPSLTIQDRVLLKSQQLLAADKSPSPAISTSHLSWAGVRPETQLPV